MLDLAIDTSYKTSVLGFNDIGVRMMASPIANLIDGTILPHSAEIAAVAKVMTTTKTTTKTGD